MALICQFELDFAQIETRYGIEFGAYFTAELASLSSMQADGLLEIGANNIRVNPLGRLLIRNICMAFDRHLSPLRHATSFSNAI